MGSTTLASPTGDSDLEPSELAWRRLAPVRGLPRLRIDLRLSLLDGVAFSLMVGLGETYVPAFALALGLDQKVAGLVASVPLIAGAVLQLVSPRAVRLLGSHRRWIVICALAQAASFLPLLVAALAGRIPVLLLFLVMAVYWGAVMGTSPAWNTWMEDLVPARIRPRYFARRSRFAHAGLLVGLLGGGLALQLGTELGVPARAFALLFGLAILFRLASALLLSRQTERPDSVAGDRPVCVRAWLRRVRGADGRLLAYLLATQTAVYISGPFFTPYMLQQLHLSYAAYMGLISASLVAKLMVLPLAGGFARRFGAHRLLRVGAVGIVPMAALWLVSDSLPYLAAAQVAAGVAWAAFELGSFLLFFEAIRVEERVAVLTLFNVANAVALVAGSLIGAALLGLCGEGARGYAVIFALSSAARLASLLVLPRAAPAHAGSVVAVAVRALAVRPSAGTMERPVVSTIETAAAGAPAESPKPGRAAAGNAIAFQASKPEV